MKRKREEKSLVLLKSKRRIKENKGIKDKKRGNKD
jgi:hypothetical protein